MPALFHFLLGGEYMMKSKYAVIIATIMLLFSFSLALAEDSNDADELDATMRLMDDAEANLPDAVTRPIKLPDNVGIANSAAVEKSVNGIEAANAGSDNSTHGRDTADAARNRASDMAEAAKDNRETHGRSEDLPDPPNRPDPPNPGGPPN